MWTLLPAKQLAKLSAQAAKYAAGNVTELLKPEEYSGQLNPLPSLMIPNNKYWLQNPRK